jgi:hypothetical protein
LQNEGQRFDAAFCLLFLSTTNMKTAECHPDRPYYARNKCKQCYHRDLNHHKNNSPDGKSYWRQHNLKRSFGLTIEEYDAMHDAQGGVCAICGRPQKNKRLAVDHNHTTGKIRGLLCTTCNRALGYLENPDWRLKADAYLAAHQRS